MGNGKKRRVEGKGKQATGQPGAGTGCAPSTVCLPTWAARRKAQRDDDNEKAEEDEEEEEAEAAQ